MKKITLIAGIGINHETYGGEAIKNKTLLDFLKRKITNSRLSVIDTFDWQKKIIFLVPKILYVLLNPKRKVIILSCFTRGGYYFLRIYRITAYLIKKDIYYFLVGGSLPDYVETDKVKLSYYKNIPMYAESENIRNRLLVQGMKNVMVIPTWKDYDYLPSFTKNESSNKKLKALFYSRICPEKGNDIIFEAVEKINKSSINIEVDFFGEIQNDYIETFKTKISDKEYYDHKGLIDMTKDENYNILSGYDIMLFPTYYSGEGIAGAVIDSLIAGVPVLASDWHFNKDIIEHLKTGIIFDSKSVDALYNALEFALANKNLIIGMRGNCIEKAKEFKIDYLLKDFIRLLNTI